MSKMLNTFITIQQSNFKAAKSGSLKDLDLCFVCLVFIHFSSKALLFILQNYHSVIDEKLKRKSSLKVFGVVLGIAKC